MVNDILLNYNYLKHCNSGEDVNIKWIADYAFLDHREKYSKVDYIEGAEVSGKDRLFSFWTKDETWRTKMPKYIDTRTAVSAAMYLSTLCKLKLPEEKRKPGISSGERKENLAIYDLPIAIRTKTRHVATYTDPRYSIGGKGGWNRVIRHKIDRIPIDVAEQGEDKVLDKFRLRLSEYHMDNYDSLFTSTDLDQQVGEEPDKFSAPEVVPHDQAEMTDLQLILNDKRTGVVEIEETIERDDGVKHTRKIKINRK